MIEYIERPSDELLDGWKKAFISFVDEKIDLPDQERRWQMRSFDVIDSNLGAPLAASRVKFLRHLFRSRNRDALILTHAVQLLHGDHQIGKISHEYSSEAALEIGRVSIELSEGSPVDTPLPNAAIRGFMNQVADQRMRLSEERPSGLMVAQVH
jgi:hypothetical protein